MKFLGGGLAIGNLNIDDGAGIAPENQERVFGVFQTLTTRDSHENTGIGLSIVKKIVESQGGTITLESELGQGATFRFSWVGSDRDGSEEQV